MTTTTSLKIFFTTCSGLVHNLFITCSKDAHDLTIANNSNVKLAKAGLSLAQLSPSLFSLSIVERDNLLNCPQEEGNLIQQTDQEIRIIAHKTDVDPHKTGI